LKDQDSRGRFSLKLVEGLFLLATKEKRVSCTHTHTHTERWSFLCWKRRRVKY